MEQAPVAKQRSPWVYVLLGCGGLAALICLGGMLVLGGIVKAGKDIADGVNDPAERKANAIKQLGGLPEGYSVVASFNMFVMQLTMLTDAEALADGGFEVDSKAHTFAFFDVMANDNSKAARDYLTGKETDPQALSKSGINIDTKNVVKRGQLTVDGRKFFWVASRGKVQHGTNEASEGLNTAVLFDCPGDALRVGVWSQSDPAPDKNNDELDLAGTVADEAELVRFLKPMNPCRK
jgi:hypothetical protein